MGHSPDTDIFAHLAATPTPTPQDAPDALAPRDAADLVTLGVLTIMPRI